MELKLATPDGAALASSAERTLSIVQDFKIDSDTMYGIAADELSAIKRKTKELEAQRVGITKPLDEAKKNVMDLFRRPLEVLAQAEATLKRAMIGYQDEQERLRKAEQARLEAAARAERERLEGEARALREEAERLAAEAAAAQAAANSNTTAESVVAAAQAAAKASEASIQAQVTAEVATMVVAPAAEISAPKVAGISTRGTWKAEVTDKMALIRFVAANPQFASLLDANQSAINQMAKAMKSTMAIDGVRAYEDKSIAARAA
jgi:DNA repair exonuclease SbcCD ATPase subunit